MTEIKMIKYFKVNILFYKLHYDFLNIFPSNIVITVIYYFTLTLFSSDHTVTKNLHFNFFDTFCTENNVTHYFVYFYHCLLSTLRLNIIHFHNCLLRTLWQQFSYLIYCDKIFYLSMILFLSRQCQFINWLILSGL